MPMDPLKPPGHIHDTVKPGDEPALAGETMRAMLARTPDAMRELMQQFIENKDLNARAAIRLRMKALLDMVSVDTAYPPLFAPDGRRDQAPMDAFHQGPGMRGDAYLDPLPAAPHENLGQLDADELRALRAVAPIPGADAALQQNAELL